MAALGISPAQFWESTPAEIYYALDAYSKERIDSIKEGWEQMRIQTYYLINIQLDKKSKIDYDAFKHFYMPYSWDKPIVQEVPEIDWEERDRRDRERLENTIKTEIIK